MKFLFALVIGLTIPVPSARAQVSPAAVGWGNILVPGLGATLRGDHGRALIEGTAEIGLFYGGTFGVREGEYSIDTTILTPRRSSLVQPLIGQIMQQVGLKVHMFNTFYHYQQACLGVADSEREKENPQKLYQGNWQDVLAAPFRFENLSSPWVYGLLLASAGALAYDYSTSSVRNNRYRPSPGEEALFGVTSIGMIPLGSAFGEEVLFRGFIQREFHLYTGSFIIANLAQAVLFAATHPSSNRLTAFLGGLYFGYLTRNFDGNLEKSIAAHFWVDVFSGIVDYLRFRVAHDENTPWAPRVTFAIPMG